MNMGGLLGQIFQSVLCWLAVSAQRQRQQFRGSTNDRKVVAQSARSSDEQFNDLEMALETIKSWGCLVVAAGVDGGKENMIERGKRRLSPTLANLRLHIFMHLA